MSNFKVAKKDALSDTRTNIYNLHEKKLEYFESEKNKILSSNFYNTEELKIKIDTIENDNINYLLDFVAIINEFDKDKIFEESLQKGIMDTFVNARINTTKSELYNEYIKKFNPELKSINIIKKSHMFLLNKLPLHMRFLLLFSILNLPLIL